MQYLPSCLEIRLHRRCQGNKPDSRIVYLRVVCCHDTAYGLTLAGRSRVFSVLGLTKRDRSASRPFVDHGGLRVHTVTRSGGSACSVIWLLLSVGIAMGTLLGAALGITAGISMVVEMEHMDPGVARDGRTAPCAHNTDTQRSCPSWSAILQYTVIHQLCMLSMQYRFGFRGPWCHPYCHIILAA